jgi:hypothetical protein
MRFSGWRVADMGRRWPGGRAGVNGCPVRAAQRRRSNACRESGHHTHGAGLAVDAQPEPGHDWPSTAQQVAEDLGWTSGCGRNGLARRTGGACDLVPAIRGIF